MSENKIINKPNIILLDMDGVIADFMGGVSEVFGKDVTSYHSWDVNKVFGLTIEEFWKKIHETEFFWLNLDPYPWAEYLIEFCEEKADEVYICTSPAMNSLCYKEKFEWIEDHFPQFKNKMIVTNNKQLLANPETILIDDSDSNCKKFYQNDGQYILFPQSWNRNNTYIIQRMTYTKTELNKIIS